MSIFLASDLDGAHEGYAAQVLDDGTVTGTYSEETMPRMVGQIVAACGCGWTGTTRYPCPEPFDEHAETLALGEWEDHARAALECSHQAELDRLDTQLRALSGAQVAVGGLSARERADRLAGLLRTLEGLHRLAERLHGWAAGEAAQSPGGRS